MSWSTSTLTRTRRAEGSGAAKAASSKIALLRSVPGLAHLPDRELGRLALLFDDIRIDAGRVLAREGQASQELVLIVEGWAALSRHGQSVDALGPGQFVGETSILDHGAHADTVTARTPMRVLLAGRESFGALRNHPEVLRQIATNLAGRLRLCDPPTA
jgi:CRP-like cAMP-binding protein